MSLDKWWRRRRSRTLRGRVAAIERALMGREEAAFPMNLAYLSPVTEQLADLNDKLNLLAAELDYKFRRQTERRHKLVPLAEAASQDDWPDDDY